MRSLSMTIYYLTKYKLMKRKAFFLSLFVAVAATMTAQVKDGGISQDMLRDIQKQGGGSANKAVFNALASNSIDNLAKNFEAQGFDTYFSHETTKQSIHNQKSSGRCWMFSGFNVLRSKFAKKHKDSINVEFSHDYLFFYDQLEKSNLMLQGAIETAKKPLDNPDVQFFFHHPIGDGGTFCGVADLADKYGVVPMSVQSETFSADNTSKMRSLISSKLREFGLELRDMVNGGKKAAAIKTRKTEMLGEIYKMLALTLGEPVKEFKYAFKNKKGQTVTETKTYTPQSFYKEVVGGPINGTFIMVMNDPRHEYYKTYEVDLDRHVYDGHNWKYLNLPMEEIEKLAIASIKDNTKLYSSYDVGKQSDRQKGYGDVNLYDYGTLFNTTFKMDKAQRIATFDSGSTHAMTLTAVDLDASGNPKKWKVENSWGPNSGQGGCMIMSAQWFREYMFRLVVDNKYVPENIMKMYQQKPVMLTHDDPLFSEDN